MAIFSIPFLVSAALVLVNANPLVSIGVGWVVLMAIMYGLTSNGGVIGGDD
jgi:hypothetical protein